MAPALVEAVDGIARLLADKAYDTNSCRAVLADKAVEPVIPSSRPSSRPSIRPSIRRRKPRLPYDAAACRQRNLIERMFCRLKDYRRVATRYDKLARNFLATAILAATIIWWIN
jgi:transposase